MQFQFIFKHMDTSEALQNYAEEKIREKVQKFVTKPIAADVIFSVMKHVHKTHLSLHAGDGFGIEVEHEAEDMYATIDGLTTKLAAQLKKHKEKLKDHKTPKISQVLAEVGEPEEEAVDAGEILKYEDGRKRAGAR